MKKIVLSFFLFYLFSASIAQTVAINTTGNTGDASAMLDISSTGKGLLIPRMSTAQIAAIAAPAKGLLVYDSTVNQFKTNIGDLVTPSWQPLTSTSSGWGLTGNSGTNAANNFIGTIDASPFNVRVNNQKAGLIDSAHGNTFWGYRAGDSTTTHGLYNTAIGQKALFLNTTGWYNTAIGESALINNKSGMSNTAIGNETLEQNTTGSYNTALGVDALQFNTTGAGNISIGLSALSGNTTGNFNMASGVNALYSNTTGNNNIASGVSSLADNTTGNSNTATGSYALYSNTTASHNTAYGDSTLYYNTTGYNNTANGAFSLLSNTTGYSNIANGYNALLSNTTGYSNIANGAGALSANTTGSTNTAIGDGALFLNTTGSGNTASGSGALSYNKTGTLNTAIGVGAGPGYNLNLTNTSAIGYGATVTQSNTIQLGNSNVTSVNTSGNIATSGNITVLNGKGLIRSNDGVQQKKVTTQVAINASIPAGGTTTIAFNFSESFSSLPDVYVGNVSVPGSGGFAELVLTVSNVTATGATLFVFNPRSVSATPSYSIKVIAIGPQ